MYSFGNKKLIDSLFVNPKGELPHRIVNIMFLRIFHSKSYSEYTALYKSVDIITYRKLLKKVNNEAFPGWN